eukprot:2068866-Prymnesium_polylepis.1
MEGATDKRTPESPHRVRYRDNLDFGRDCAEIRGSHLFGILSPARAACAGVAGGDTPRLQSDTEVTAPARIENEANLLTEDCLDPCPAYEQERSRATHCLTQLTNMMETGVRFNTSAARQQWLEYSACAPGTPRTTEAVVLTCYELSSGDREAQRNLRRGEHLALKAFRVCMNDAFSGKTQWDVRLHALYMYAVATNPVGCFVLLFLSYVIIRCYGFGALLTCVFGTSAEAALDFRLVRGLAHLAWMVQRFCGDWRLWAVVTRIHLQGCCCWFKALMTCKAITGGVCLVAAGVYSAAHALRVPSSLI